MDDEVVGWAKLYNNLWFVLVNKAGHMVPTDQPHSALNMMAHFIHNEYDFGLWWLFVKIIKNNKSDDLKII